MDEEKKEFRYAVEVEGLVKNYKKKSVFSDMSVKLNENRIIGLIGENGSGKTTFFKILAGLENYQKGIVRTFDADPWKDMGVREKMILSMHDLPYGRWGTKLKHIEDYYEIMYDEFDRKFADGLMQMFELSKNQNYHKLSVGMKSIFNFILAMASRCSLTLLDEPFIGVDVKRRKVMYDVLLRDYMEYERTFVVSSHNISEIEGVLSDIMFIHEGKVLFYKEMDEVREMLCELSADREIIESIREEIRPEDIVEAEHHETGSILIVRAKDNQDLIKRAREKGVQVSWVSPENVCACFMRLQNEGMLDSLWERK